MNRLAAGLSITAAFVAGCGATHLLRPALAAESIAPQIIHTSEMEGDALGDANKVGYRSKTFMTADGATVSIQDASAMPRSREAIASTRGALLWVDVEEALYPAGWEAPGTPPLHTGAVDLSGIERVVEGER